MEKAIANITNFQLKIALLAEQIKQYEDAGFTNCENVVKLRNELSQIQYDKYADKYPAGYIFFTDKQFDEIVQRNKLVIFTCETYTGSIPDHCFEAIKTENIDKDDIRENSFCLKITSSATGEVMTFDNITLAQVKQLTLSKEALEYYISIGSLNRLLAKLN